MQRVTSSLIQSVSTSQVDGDIVNGRFPLFKGTVDDGQTLKYVLDTDSWIAADLGASMSTTYLALTGGTLTGLLTGTTATFAEMSATSFFGNGINLTNVLTLSEGKGVLTSLLSGTTAIFNELSANYFYGDGSRLQNVGTPNALPLSGGTITDFLAVSNSFSTRNMLLGQEDEGAFFGRTKIKENNISLIESTIGTNWNIVPSTNGKNWIKIATSSNGRVTAALASNDTIYVSTNYGATWAEKASVQFWSDVAVSLDGKVMLATTSGNSGEVYLSTDYGDNWNSILPLANKDWRGVAMSSDSKFRTVVGVDSEIYISHDYGANWSPVDSPRDWRDVAMSSNGRIQTAVAHGGHIYVSVDYGSTWEERGSPGISYNSVSMSADGKIQIATGTALANVIFVSSNYGQLWEATGNGQGPGWNDSAISSDGKYVTATGLFGYIYISSNYGNNAPWTISLDLSESVTNFKSVTMSSDAKVQYVVTENGSIYISNADSVFNGSLTVTKSLSVSQLSGTFIGNGARITNIPYPVTTVATRTGDITITTADLADFTTASQTAAKALVGQNNGLAGLDGSGKIPSSYIPASIDEIIEVDLLSGIAASPTLSALGELKTKIYFTLNDFKTYRWSGTQYNEIVSSPGTTDALIEGSLLSRRYYTPEREDLLLKKSGGTMTGMLTITSVELSASSWIRGDTSSFTTISALSVYAMYFGDGSNIKNIAGTDTLKLPLSGGVLTGTGILSVVGLSGMRATFLTSVSAPALRGTLYGNVVGVSGMFTSTLTAAQFIGDGSKLTGVVSSGGSATDNSKLPLAGGVLTGTLTITSADLSASCFIAANTSRFTTISALSVYADVIGVSGTGVFTRGLSTTRFVGDVIGVSGTGVFTTNLSTTRFVGDGSRLTNIVTSVASRVGAVTITSADLSDFTSAAVTAAKTIAGLDGGFPPLNSSQKIPLQYIAGSVALLITATNFDSLTALQTADSGKDRENLYLTNNNGKLYRYSGVPPLSYVEIVAAPGDTDSVPEGLVARSNRTNRYYTGTREDELIKKLGGGTITGNLTATSGAFTVDLSATNITFQTLNGSGANLTGIVKTVASRSGDVLLTSGDVTNFNSATKTVIKELTGVPGGIVPLDSAGKISPDYIVGGATASIAAINYTIDGGGDAITTGSKGFVQIPTNFVVKEWGIFADVPTTSFIVDVRKASFADLPTTTSIVGADYVKLTNQQKNRNLSVTWTNISAGDFLEFFVTDVSNAAMINISLKGNRS